MMVAVHDLPDIPPSQSSHCLFPYLAVAEVSMNTAGSLFSIALRFPSLLISHRRGAV